MTFLSSWKVTLCSKLDATSAIVLLISDKLALVNIYSWNSALISSKLPPDSYFFNVSKTALKVNLTTSWMLVHSDVDSSNSSTNPTEPRPVS